MNDINTHAIETQTALAVLEQRSSPAVAYGVYVGLDVHKDTIAVAIAEAGRSAPVSWGEIANRPKTIAKLVDRLTRAFDGQLLLFCYEAGPCGYVLYRQLLSLGHDCQVVAPSLLRQHR